MDNNNLKCSKVVSTFDATLYQLPNLKYVSPVKSGLNQIPIIACSGVIWYNLPREKQIRQLSECKFNVGIIEGDEGFLNGVIGAFKNVIFEDNQDVNVRFIINNKNKFHPSEYNETNVEALKTYLDNYIKETCIAGCEYADEPKWEDIQSETYRKFYNQMVTSTFGSTLYLNLIGGNQKKFTNGIELSEYLNIIQDIFRPMVWSFDSYPISVDRETLYEKTTKDGKDIYTERIVTRLKINSEGFYAALEAYSRQSQLTQRPFWYYCESVGYVTTSSNTNRPEPTYPFLKFQVFNALAYGAKGIAYWTSRQRMDEPETIFYAAPVDYMNNPTPAFEAVKTVNSEILEYGEIFMNSNVMKLVHVGKEEFSQTCVWDNTDEIPFGPVDSIGVARTDGSNKRTTPAGVVMSHLATTENDYLMIVSRDPICAQFVNIKFSERFKIFEYTPLSNFDNGDEIVNGFEMPSMTNPVLVEQQIRRFLPGGAYIIFSWEKL